MNEDLDRLNKAVDSLTEQKKNLNIALYYTHSDMEKAKKMISGTYKDLYVIKARFSASTTFGAFLIFFNIPYCSIVNSFVIMSHSYSVEDLKTNLQWRIFEENMDKINKMGNHDSELTLKMNNELPNAFTIKIGAGQRANELKKHLELDDEIAANRVIKKFIQDKFGFQIIDLSVNYEQISSLDMELYSLTSKKIDIESTSIQIEKKEEEPKIEMLPDDKNELEEKNVQMILQGSLVLSPIKGKSMSSIINGDRLKITLNTSNPKAISIAKAFKAYDDGKIFPISGRVVSIKHLIDGGYKLFCLIAKGIYVKIEEDEENIKVAVDEPENRVEYDANTSKVPLIITLSFIFIVLVCIIIMIII